MSQYGQYADGTGGAGYGGYGGGGIRLSAVPGALLRQMVWAIPLILLLSLLIVWFTKDIKRQYVAGGRLLVQLGPEYVYNPASGSANFNSPLSITSDQVTLTEIGIIKNSAIIDQVIQQMIASPANGGVGGEVFAPKLYEKWVRAEKRNKVDRWNDLVKLVDTSYAVVPSPKAYIVDLAYKHPDPDVAVKTLDTFMTAYANFRKQKFVITQTGNLAQRRADTEEQLAAIEARIQAILNKNGISDFTTEQTGARTRAEALRTQLNTLRGRLSAAEAALAASEDQLRQTPKTIDLYVDDRGSQRLAQAQLEKRQLLAKYLPTSNPVRAKEAEIRELQAQINSNGGKPQGGRRVGQNTVYQALLTQRNTFQSTADSLREQEITLQKQVNAAIAKVKRLRELGPTYTNLVREKTTIEERLSGLQARETEALVDEQQLENSSENIKFITRPSMARKGRNMKKILRALGFLGAAFSVFMLALLRVFLDPKLYGPGPHARLQQTNNPMPEQVYYNDIPEAVPNYPGHFPDDVPMPAYAPAARAGMEGGLSHAGYDQGGYDQGGYSQSGLNQDTYGQAGYEPSPYGEPAPVEYVDPTQDSIYADGTLSGGNLGTANPYMSAPAQPYPAASGVSEQVGPDGNIPVIAQTGATSKPEPYT